MRYPYLASLSGPQILCTWSATLCLTGINNTDWRTHATFKDQAEDDSGERESVCVCVDYKGIGAISHVPVTLRTMAFHHSTSVVCLRSPRGTLIADPARRATHLSAGTLRRQQSVSGPSVICARLETTWTNRTSVERPTLSTNTSDPSVILLQSIRVYSFSDVRSIRKTT